MYERLASRTRFEADGTSVRETEARIKVQSDAGVQQLGVLNFAYTTANGTMEIPYVRVRKPDGTVVTTPAENIQDMPAEVTRVAPTYSDIHEKHVVVKGLAAGDTLEYLFRFRVTKPEVPNQFWFVYAFVRDAVASDEELEIDVPADKYVRVSSPSLAPIVRTAAGRRIYSWKTANLGAHKDDSDTIPRRLAPLPSVELTSFRSWEEVGRWYSELQKPQAAVTPAIQAKAEELTKGITDDDEKVRALYEFVSMQIHYVALSFGVGRFRPHSADDVLGNGYGDCKDKHTLLQALLRAQGIDSWPVLVNAVQEFDADTPSPGQFNHLITAVPRGKEIYWLDTTPEVAPFRLLLANLRGREALAMPGSGAASLMKLPDVPPLASSSQFIAEGKLSPDGTLQTHMERKVSGEQEVLLRLAFRNVPQAQWKELVQQVSNGTGFGGEVSNITAAAPADASKPFAFSYDYTRKQYSDWDNGRIGPPLPIFGVEAVKNDKRKPVEPFYLGAPGELDYRAKVELPAGYTLMPPKAVDIVRDFAEYHATYAFDHGVFTAERKLVIKKQFVEVAAWDEYRSFGSAVSDDENNYITLVSGKSTAVDAEVDQLFDEGDAALRRNDYVAAGEVYRQILAKKADARGAHGGLGVALISTGHPDEGVKELLREEELNPSDSYAYRHLALYYLYRRQDDYAIAQLRGLLKAEPTDRMGLTLISENLLDKNRNAEAIEILEAAQKQAPDSAYLKILLGSAYLRSGQKEKGAGMLVEGVKADPTLDNLTLGAHVLAKENAALDQAEDFSQRSLHDLETQAAGDSDANFSAFTRVSRLCTAWESQGLVSLDAQHWDQAVPYLSAAWKMCQWGNTGKYLGQLFEKEGKKAEAAHMYRLAYEGEFYDRTSVAADKKAIREAYEKLTGKEMMDAPVLARRASTKFEPLPGEELSRMRTLPVTKTPHKPGNATFQFLFSPGKTELVKFVKGDEALRPMAEQLRSSKIGMDFPDAGPVKVAREGILSCGPTGCDLVLLLPNLVQVRPN